MGKTEVIKPTDQIEMLTLSALLTMTDNKLRLFNQCSSATYHYRCTKHCLRKPAYRVKSCNFATNSNPTTETMLTNHLRELEAEAIHIIREVAAEFSNPVMLYSIGKDSSVLKHLAMKAFFPGKLPFPFLHIDTTWKFKEMIAFRNRLAAEGDIKLITHVNQDGLRQGINPFTYNASVYTQIMKTEALRQALDNNSFDAAIGGARRDEERARAKERIFSFRTANHSWDPKNQRPEIWKTYNTLADKGETIRVFPLSNWTELDVWQYIAEENISIVSLYFAAKRRVINRDGELIVLDDERMPLTESDLVEERSVRFRTLGCYPLTGAVESTATSIVDVIREIVVAKTSERQSRLIDRGHGDTMEKKKREGYF